MTPGRTITANEKGEGDETSIEQETNWIQVHFSTEGADMTRKRLVEMVDVILGMEGLKDLVVELRVGNAFGSKIWVGHCGKYFEYIASEKEMAYMATIKNTSVQYVYDPEFRMAEAHLRTIKKGALDDAV